jgi:hypothetical protein
MRNDEHLQEHNNGELQLAHYNAVMVDHDPALQDQIEETMKERGWSVELDTPPAGNPTWTYHGKA